MVEDIDEEDVLEFRTDIAAVVGHTSLMQAEILKLCNRNLVNQMKGSKVEPVALRSVLSAFGDYCYRLTLLQKAAVKLLKGNGKLKDEDVPRIGLVYKQMLTAIDKLVDSLKGLDQPHYDSLHGYTLKIRSHL